jgi:hypothetical protein
LTPQELSTKDVNVKPVQVRFDDELLAALDAADEGEWPDECRLDRGTINRVCRALAVAPGCDGDSR